MMMQSHVTRLGRNSLWHRAARNGRTSAERQVSAVVKCSLMKDSTALSRRNKGKESLSAKMRRLSVGDLTACGSSQKKKAVWCKASMTLNEEADTLTLQELKDLLDDTLWGTGRGLSANSDTRAEITDLIAQLEAKNPTPGPNEATEKLSGEWRLVYTSNSELIPLLALGKLPLVEVGDVTQTIYGSTGRVENKIELSVPFSKTTVGSTATFDVRSPKLLEIKFTDGKISTPELMSDFELPSSVDVAGQVVDLSPVKTALQPLDGPVRSALAQAGAFLAGQPDFTFSTPSNQPATWLLNTYLDDELRIARGDGGSLFIMKKAPRLELPEKIEVEDQSQGTDYSVVAAIQPEEANDADDDDEEAVNESKEDDDSATTLVVEEVDSPYVPDEDKE